MIIHFNDGTTQYTTDEKEPGKPYRVTRIMFLDGKVQMKGNQPVYSVFDPLNGRMEINREIRHLSYDVGMVGIMAIVAVIVIGRTIRLERGTPPLKK